MTRRSPSRWLPSGWRLPLGWRPPPAHRLLLAAAGAQLLLGGLLWAAAERVDLLVAPATPRPALAAPAPAGPGAALATPAEPARIRLPSLSVDLPVEPSVPRDGVYSVPWAALGHHSGTPVPGQPGNAVFVGHVLHLPLRRLQVGEPIELIAADGQVALWLAVASWTTPAGDASFIDPDPGGPVRLTLYTCEGDYDWRSGEYALRRVVMAQPAAQGATATP